MQYQLSMRTVAEYWRLTLSLRLVEPAAIAAWADERIAGEAEATSPLLDLSLGAHLRTDELLELLSQLPGELDQGAAIDAVLGQLERELREGRLSPRITAAVLANLQAVVPVEEQRYADLMQVDTGLALADQGIERIEDVFARMHSWLATYRDADRRLLAAA